MRYARVITCALVSLFMLFAGEYSVAYAAKVVGKAAAIKGSVSGKVQGKSRKLSKGKPVHLNERIRAGSGSSGQFILLDNSKIAVGARATIVLDDFVVSSGNRAKRVSIKVLKGALRFSSGRSRSKAYKITTPTATLGVRGTLFEVAVTRGTTNVLLLRGAMDVCGRGGCRRLKGPCSYAVVRRGRAVKTGNTKKGNAASRRGVKASTFPLERRQRGLLRSLRSRRAKCFGAATQKRGNRKAPKQTRKAAVVPPTVVTPPTAPPTAPPGVAPGNPGNTSPNGKAGTSPGNSADKGNDGRGASESNRGGNGNGNGNGRGNNRD